MLVPAQVWLMVIAILAVLHVGRHCCVVAHSGLMPVLIPVVGAMRFICVLRSEAMTVITMLSTTVIPVLSMRVVIFILANIVVVEVVLSHGLSGRVVHTIVVAV